MTPSYCANRASSVDLSQLRLGFESLEDRELLSVNQLGETDLSYQFDVLSSIDPLHHSQGTAVMGEQEATEFWEDLNRREILLNDGEIVSVGSQPEQGSEQPATPLPAIPIDDSIDPFTDCPGLDGDFCLPGDANQDGRVDVIDFLRVSHNFGMSGASWEDGDFDGDGRVTFGDFLILSSMI